MRLARLIARVFIGALFIGHGTQKLFGWFGGPGLEGTSQWMESVDMRPGHRNALASGAAETIGGAAIAAGALTSAAAAALIGTMLTAIRLVHLEKGFFNTQGGYEFNLTLIAALLLLVDGGAGDLSVDKALGIEDCGTGWALASLAAGAAGSYLVVAAGHAAASEQDAPQST
jgi:putative oxidoreductase